MATFYEFVMWHSVSTMWLAKNNDQRLSQKKTMKYTYDTVTPVHYFHELEVIVTFLDRNDSCTGYWIDFAHMQTVFPPSLVHSIMLVVCFIVPSTIVRKLTLFYQLNINHEQEDNGMVL